MAIYACGVLAGLSCGVPDPHARRSERARRCAPSSVRIWGLRGPLGAFICAWGGVAMLASAPFDDWWHNAYGLDVQIISPPHMVLAAGILRHRFRHGDADAGVREPRRRRGAAATAAAVALRRRHGGAASRCCSNSSTSAAPSMHSALFYTVAVFGTLGIRHGDCRRVAASLGLHDVLTGVYTRLRCWRFSGSCRSFRRSRSSDRSITGHSFHPVGISAAA